jgi:pimeloyl-ACP methyl ester carboxylesterase
MALVASKAQAQNYDSLRCHHVFETAPTTLAEIDDLTREHELVLGNRVDVGVIRIDGREDWKVDYEFVAGDPKQPLIVIVNGFIWPRENSAPFMGTVFDIGAEAGPRYNVLRYDMSGQGKTIALFTGDGEAPWFMKETLTIEKLRKEIVQVVQQSLVRNGLPQDHPIILVSLSYGRAVLAAELVPQTKFIVDVSGMIRSLDHYNADGAAWGATLDMMRWNPFLSSTADYLQAQKWREFYRKFYGDNPDKVPPGVLPEWYIEGGAMRTNAVEAYDANRHTFPGVPTIMAMAEIDDPKLKKDQLKYFRDTLAKQAPATLLYMRGASHGMFALIKPSIILSAIMNSVALGKIDLIHLPEDGRVFEAAMSESNQTSITLTTVEALLKEIK